jgi:hypothetical protein
MTLEQAMAKATADLDDMVALMIEQAKRLIAGNGGTEAEVEIYLSEYEPQLLEWRNQTRASLRSWLMRDGETLQ